MALVNESCLFSTGPRVKLRCRSRYDKEWTAEIDKFVVSGFVGLLRHYIGRVHSVLSYEDSMQVFQHSFDKILYYSL